MKQLVSKPACATLFSFFVVLLCGGCTIKMQPIPMDARVGYIQVAEKLPLSAAVVTPNPASHRIMYTAPGGSPVDQTEQMNESIWPVNRELGRASVEAFSQVFDQVASLRQLPLPGEYDIVIEVRIKEVQMKAFMGGWEMTEHIAFDWQMSVLDNQSVEIFKKTGLTRSISFIVPASFDTTPFVRLIGEKSSELMSEMVKEWAQMLRYSSEIRSYVKRG